MMHEKDNEVNVYKLPLTEEEVEASINRHPTSYYDTEQHKEDNSFKVVIGRRALSSGAVVVDFMSHKGKVELLRDTADDEVNKNSNSSDK